MGATSPEGDGRRQGIRRWRLVRARTDAVPASVRRFNQRARRRRLQSATPWLVTLGVLGLCLLLGWIVFGSPVLGVDRVLVQGVVIASPDDVRTAAAIRSGTPLASLDSTAVVRRVARVPAVRHARMVRDWPDTVIIEVDERVGFAAVPVGSAFGVMDDSGVVFETVYQPPAGLPLIRLAHPGPDDATTRAVLVVAAALTPQLRGLLKTLVGEAPTRIRLELTDGRQVLWGDEVGSPEKARVATVLLAREGTIIDVSAPGVVTVR